MRLNIININAANILMIFFIKQILFITFCLIFFYLQKQSLKIFFIKSFSNKKIKMNIKTIIN